MNLVQKALICKVLVENKKCNSKNNNSKILKIIIPITILTALNQETLKEVAQDTIPTVENKEKNGLLEKK